MSFIKDLENRNFVCMLFQSNSQRLTRHRLSRNWQILLGITNTVLKRRFFSLLFVCHLKFKLIRIGLRFVQRTRSNLDLVGKLRPCDRLDSVNFETFPNYFSLIFCWLPVVCRAGSIVLTLYGMKRSMSRVITKKSNQNSLWQSKFDQGFREKQLT